MKNDLSFPMSGFHKGYKTTNNHSVFELVNKDQMYTQSKSSIITPEIRKMILEELTEYVKLTKTELNSFLEDSAPFGWMSTATKSDGLAFQGSFIKRIMNWAWKTQQVRLPLEYTSKIGNMVGKLTSGGDGAMFLRFDPLANYEAGQFGDSESCFWTTRKSARMCIRNEGGSFVLFFDREEAHLKDGRVVNGEGISRGWIMPVNQFLGYSGFAFVVNNFYSKDESRMNSFNMARAIANTLGMSYKKIDLNTNLSTLFVNNNKSFLVSDDPLLLEETGAVSVRYEKLYDSDTSTDPELNWFIKQVECPICHRQVDSRNINTAYAMCEECRQRYAKCRHCQKIIRAVDSIRVRGNAYCSESCIIETGYKKCPTCNAYHSDSTNTAHCYEHADSHFKCQKCGQYNKKETALDPNHIRCDSCETAHVRYLKRKNSASSSTTPVLDVADWYSK